MKLEEIIKGIRTNHVAGPLDREIEALTYDSRRVGPNTLFIALKGEKVDGTQFVPKAVAAGATAVISETEAEAGTATKILVSNSRDALADLAANFYRHPSSQLKVAAVTGTNGKTTTTFLIKQICDQAMLWRCGLIGTVQYQVGDKILPAARTTPESLDVHELLGDGLGWLQGRCDGSLLSRAHAGARAGRRIRRRRFHQSDAGPPRLSQDDGGLFSGQGAAVQRACRPKTRRARP
jgi:UDP-N-acetylmuramyl tripeptide synthase